MSQSTPELTDSQVIVDRLSKGHSLANRGTGWWIEAPRAAYSRSIVERVADAVVKELEAAGRIKITVPYTSAIAQLV